MGEKVCARRGNLMRCIAVISLLVATMSAQNAPSTNKRRHLDIPAISREARGAVVSIVMADKSGQPIAQGSGFIVSRDGQIVTNYHVIKTGASAVVKLPDGSFFNVDGVLAFDKKRDIALIKAHGNNFKTVALGDSNQLQIGEEVVAMAVRSRWNRPCQTVFSAGSEAKAKTLSAQLASFCRLQLRFPMAAAVGRCSICSGR